MPKGRRLDNAFPSVAAAPALSCVHKGTANALRQRRLDPRRPIGAIYRRAGLCTRPSCVVEWHRRKRPVALVWLAAACRG
jgi:hypothetical protein